MSEDPDIKEFVFKILRKTLDFKEEINGELVVGAVYADRLEKLIRENPVNGIRKIVDFYNKALDDAYTFSNAYKDGVSRGYVDAMTGGPAETVPWAIYNAVGSVYPELNRENKDLALQELFEIFGRIRYDIVQEVHTLGIREPLLLSDIKIAQPLYWPGMEEGKNVLSKYPDFQSLKEALIDENGLFFHSGIKWDLKHIIEIGKPDFRAEGVHSDFVVAYSLLRSDFCDHGEDYVRVANPNFLNRVIKGIVAMRFADAENEDEIEKGRARLIELLPEQLHDQIEPIRIKGDWADTKKNWN